MNNVDSVDEKNFYMNEEEEEEEVLRQLQEMQQFQTPSSTSSGASSSQNNNYKYTESDVESLKSEIMNSTSAIYESGLKQEESLQQQQQQHYSIQQQFFQHDNSPLQHQGQQQIFTYTTATNSEAQLSDSSALHDTITSLSCAG